MCGGDLSREAAGLGPLLDRAISRVLARGQFILGEELESFERRFAAYAGARHCAGVASGTEAIALALWACGVKPQDEVITVSFTAAPTAVAISMTGAIPRFVDVTEDHCLIDAGRVEAAITERTKAIVPVHLYGQCADMDGIMNFCLGNNVFNNF